MRVPMLSLIVIGVLAAGSAFAAEGDAAAGKKAFEGRCGFCHSVTPGQNKAGPSLAGIAGRKAGSLDGFKYTDALKNSGLTFDAATLDSYLTAPRKTVPGTAMVIGVPEAKTRADIIAYLSNVK